MPTQELTPEQIAEYSKVIAEYIDKNVMISSESYIKNRKVSYSSLIHPKNVKDWNKVFTKYHSDRNWQHEVWEKVRIDDNLLYLDEGMQLIATFEKTYLYGTLIETFSALVEAVKFINSLKK